MMDNDDMMQGKSRLSYALTLYLVFTLTVAMPLLASAGPTTEVTMELPKGWSMISLPVRPEVATVTALFPEAVVVYKYQKGTGYVRVQPVENLEVGMGYWILLNNPQTCVIRGTAITEYSIAVADGWYMIGGCSLPAQKMVTNGRIDVIYGYTPGIGYERLPESEPLKQGKGYWTLLGNTSEGAGFTARVATIIPLISLQITSPSDGALITRPDIMVEGRVKNATGNETRITVNEIVAMVYGNQFVANHVLLQEVRNRITVNAVDAEGHSATVSINVSMEPIAYYVRLIPSVESGIAPLDVDFRADVFLGSEPVSTEVVWSGPTDLEVTSVSNKVFTISFPDVPGMYYIAFSATDTKENVYSDTVVITVLERAQLDALLQAKWNGMKQALMDVNVEGALGYFHEKSRVKYGEIFTLLQDEIGSLFSSLGDIELIYLKETMAKYRIRRYQNIEGQDRWVTYYIYFVKDGQGCWKIRSF